MPKIRYRGTKPRITRSDHESWKSNLLTIVLKDAVDKKAAEEIGKEFNLRIEVNEIGKFIGHYDAESVQTLINARANQIRTYTKRGEPIPRIEEFTKKHEERKQKKKEEKNQKKR